VVVVAAAVTSVAEVAASCWVFSCSSCC
jgi:hypothetical protein